MSETLETLETLKMYTIVLRFKQGEQGQLLC